MSEQWTREQHKFYNRIYDLVMMIYANPDRQVKGKGVELKDFSFWGDGAARFTLIIPTEHKNGSVHINLTIHPDLKDARERLILEHLENLVYSVQAEAR